MRMSLEMTFVLGCDVRGVKLVSICVIYMQSLQRLPNASGLFTHEIAARVAAPSSLLFYMWRDEAAFEIENAYALAEPKKMIIDILLLHLNQHASDRTGPRAIECSNPEIYIYPRD